MLWELRVRVEEMPTVPMGAVPFDNSSSNPGLQPSCGIELDGQGTEGTSEEHTEQKWSPYDWLLHCLWEARTKRCEGGCLGFEVDSGPLTEADVLKRAGFVGCPWVRQRARECFQSAPPVLSAVSQGSLHSLT